MRVVLWYPHTKLLLRVCDLWVVDWILYGSTVALDWNAILVLTSTTGVVIVASIACWNITAGLVVLCLVVVLGGASVIGNAGHVDGVRVGIETEMWSVVCNVFVEMRLDDRRYRRDALSTYTTAVTLIDKPSTR